MSAAASPQKIPPESPPCSSARQSTPRKAAMVLAAVFLSGSRLSSRASMRGTKTMAQFSSRDTEEEEAVCRAVSSALIQRKKAVPMAAPASRVLRPMCRSLRKNRTARTAKARRQRTARRLKVSIASSASLLKMKDVALAEMTAARSSSYLFIRRPARRITAPPRRRCFLCSRGRRRSLRRNISPGPRQAPRARRGHGPGLGS